LCSSKSRRTLQGVTYERPDHVDRLRASIHRLDRGDGPLSPLGADEMFDRCAEQGDINPSSFTWRDVGAGAQIKELGTFAELGTRLAMIGVDAGS